MDLKEILTRETLSKGIEYGIVGVAVLTVLLGFLNMDTAMRITNENYHKVLSESYACFDKNTLICYEQNAHQFCRLPGNAVVDMGMIGLNFTGLG